MKLRAFAEGIEPDNAANDKYHGSVGDEDPVENDETHRNVISLDDCSDGQEAGEQERNAHDKSSIQVSMTKNHIQKQVIPPPQDREHKGYNAGDCNAQREEPVEAI